jgi:2Fe-2S ferredoxin
MVKLRFEPAGFETEARPGERLIDVTDEHPQADVPYSCRSASCGTCRVEVLEGEEALVTPEDDELEVLHAFGDEPRVRLCCQLRLARSAESSSRVVLRVVEPLP